MPLGPAQEYIVTYNGEQLPGYAQSEDDPSEATLVDNYAFGWNGSITQFSGLVNKQLKMQFKVWEPTYRDCKDQYHYATTILRSKRDGFADLRVDFDDRHFVAKTKTISYNQTVDQNAHTKLLTYTVEWDCMPWIIANDPIELSGFSDNIVTTGRTLDDGGWSPVYLVVTGTNFTISGYTATEPFTGFVSVSGSVDNFVIDTENATSTDDSRMKWKDYGLWVGAGETTFATEGVEGYFLTYYNRWY